MGDWATFFYIIAFVPFSLLGFGVTVVHSGLFYFQEHEKTESEKAEMQAKVEEEITRLQENLKRLQQVSNKLVVSVLSS